jgi:hypothetical protein
MPFNYNSLKKITGDGLVDLTVTSNDIQNNSLTTANFDTDSVTNDKLASNTVSDASINSAQITAAKMAASAVDVSTSVATGTLPLGLGGLGVSSLTGSANRTVMGNTAGDAFAFQDAGLVSVQVFSSNGTWTRPSGITRIRVQLVGGGGGGTGHGEAGGSGGYSERYLDVTSISSVGVTIGGGGGGVNYHNVGGGGATTSFGPYLSASGGEGARNVGGHCGGRPGIGSGGDVNLYGGGGAGHCLHGGGLGGFSYFGGSGIGVHAESPDTAAFESWSSPGAGGSGGAQARHRGASGKGGIIIVYEYR